MIVTDDGVDGITGGAGGDEDGGGNIGSKNIWKDALDTKFPKLQDDFPNKGTTHLGGKKSMIPAKV